MDDLKKSFANALQQPDMLGEKRFKEQLITDLPVLITEDGTVVCIKKRDEVNAIAIVGGSGTGKSSIMQQLVEGIFYNWNQDVALLNDYSDETLDWSEPSDIAKFMKMGSRIGLKPTPLPIVYCYPHTKTLNLDEDNLINKNYVKMSLPLKEVLDNLPFYFNAICPEFKLGQSTMYAQNLIEDFEACEVPEDFYEVIETKIENIRTFKGMKEKIKNAFKAVFAEQILRITAPDAPAFLKIDDYIANPMCTIMYANGIPSLVVSDLRNKKYQNAIIAYYIDSIFENQSREEFLNRKVYVVFDELGTICKTDDKENNPAKTKIINIVARGRINRIGIIYATQMYDKIPHEIKSAKLNYLITFKTSKEIAKEIASDFVLDEIKAKEITKLNILEAIALTTDKFVCYKDGKKWESNEPFRGKIIPPCSKHLKA